MVIGGSGFIGGRLVEALDKNNMETISYDIIRSNEISERAKWIGANILELASIERIFFEYDVEAIIHLVGLPAIEYCEKNPEFSFLLNVMSVQNALEAMRKTDIKKIVFASSAAVYGYHSERPVQEMDARNPSTIYGYHKLLAEEAIRSYRDSYGLNYVILRLFNVYGGDPHTGKDVISIFLRRALRGEPLMVKGPNKHRDFVHVDDVVQAFVNAASSNLSDMAMNVGSGERTTLRQVAEVIKKSFPQVEIKEEITEDDGTGLQADITLAMSKLGFSPRRSIEGIGEYVDSYVR